MTSEDLTGAGRGDASRPTREASPASYATHALVGALIVTGVATLQYVVVLDVRPELTNYAAPLLVGLVAGLVVAKIRSLNRQLSHHVARLNEQEQALAATNRTLEERVAQRTEELRRREAELHSARRIEALGRLAGGVAHDFNNLLAVVLMASEDLMAHLPPGSPHHEIAREVHAAGLRGAGLTRQLLTFGRRHPGHPEPFDLNAMIRDLTPMLQRVLGERVALKLELDNTPLLLLADRGQVEQVVLNLVMNASDAVTDEGHVLIAARGDADPPMSVADGAEGSWIALEVRDDGAGMDAETAARALEVFFTTKDPGRGTGLGLSTVYGVVRQSGGEVQIRSELGVGTCVCVTLPRATDVRVAS